MELLEREGALAALRGAYECAASGTGRVVLVTGEPGIGKTWLVKRFLDDVNADRLYAAKILFGTCDDLSIPRPLGPIRDLAGAVSPALADALGEGGAPHDIQTLLIDELQVGRPTVLVLEDVHWADDATLDTITVLGRRIGVLPALLVMTFRGGEVPLGHRLHSTVGAFRPGEVEVVQLMPLSVSAVTELAGADAERVYAVTKGNPFYVTELLASRTAAQLPPSVANAVLGRVSRLEDDARRLVELVSVVPGRVRTSLLDSVMPDWPSSAEEPERRQLLEIDASWVRFRHELTRHAIRSSIPIALRRRLHAEMLEALLAANADPADIVHHAEAAGTQDVIAEYALIAGRRAAALGSRREAYSHYRRVSAFLDRLSLDQRVVVLEEHGYAAYLVNRIDEAFDLVGQAIELYRQLGNEEAVGRCMRIVSRLHWFMGNGPMARSTGLEAIAILEPLGESIELARAYSGVSQLAMLAQDVDETVTWGNKALELGTRLGDHNTQAHARVNISSVTMQVDIDGAGDLLDAHAFADSVGETYEAARALTNAAFTLMYWGKPIEAIDCARQANAYSKANEVHNLESYSAIVIAWLQLRAGDWDEAERVTQAEIEKGITVTQLLAKTVLTELAIRRGDADASDRLDDLSGQADRTRELQRIGPVVEFATEFALTRGTPIPKELFDTLARDFRTHSMAGWGAIRMAAWSAVAGIDIGFVPAGAGPFGAMADREWLAAADEFGKVGWTYDRALMLSLLDEEEHLNEAIDIARRLGAVPLTKRVTRRMRELGMRVPHPQRESTRVNPAGLTARQLEVLALVADGLTNAEIADRLVVSLRTAEHHVAAVLTKLGVTTRRAAAHRAAELGLGG